MNIEDTLSYWSDLLKIPKKQFIKPYIKKSMRENITQKGYGHGTCGIYIYNRYLKEKIISGITSITENITGIPEDLI